MRQLLLLRHAKSSWADPKLDDRERPLSPRGERAAAEMGQAMREVGLSPDVVLVSPARRAMQTLRALEPWDETPLIEPMETLYLASAAQLLGALNAVATMARSVLLVAHNPGLHDLAVLLVGPQAMTLAHSDMRRLAAGLPAGALVEFTVPAPWSELAEGGGRLQRFVAPRDLAAGAAHGAPA